MKKIIIVGSGASGVQSAKKLLDHGYNVCMIDHGQESRYKNNNIPEENFSQIRKTELNQAKFFLGDRLEGIPFGNIKTGNKLAPFKKHIIADNKIGNLTHTDGFVMNQSLATGGLAQSWGAGSMPLRDEDLKQYPISHADLAPYYAELAHDIGVSGANDDLIKIIDMVENLQPPLEIDTQCSRLYASYKKKRKKFNKSGIFMGRAWLAVCSQKLPQRDACQYLDMELWGDPDKSVYRPQWTLEELNKNNNFEYLSGYDAISFKENDDGVSLQARDIKHQENHTFHGHALILAAGVPNSAKIAAASSNHFGKNNAFSIRTNAHTYVPAIYLPILGKKVTDRKSSLAQLNILYRPETDPDVLLYSGVYTYRSLLTFKLLKEAPLPFRFSMDLFKNILPSLMILNIFHTDNGTGDKKIWFNKEHDGSITTHISYKEDPSVTEKQILQEKTLLKKIAKLGLIPIKRIRRNPGSSIHYSGTLPLNRENHAMTCQPNGQLRPYDNVWVVDGSALVTMPSLLPTFTIMANALRVSDNIARKLKTG